MPVITTNTNTAPAPPSNKLIQAANVPSLETPTADAPPAKSIDAQIEAERANIDTAAMNDDSDVDVVGNAVDNNVVAATPVKELNPAQQKLADIKAKAEANAAKKKAEEALKSDAKAKATQEKADKKAVADALKADAKAKADAEKALIRAQKEQEKADAKAKADAEKAAKKAAAKVPAPLLPAVEVKPVAESMIKTLQTGKASTALKAAFSAENNAELGYKELGSRYNWSVKDLVAELVAEKVWPVKDDGSAWGYQKLYQTERENNLVSWGHMVNRASERFTMLNPANIQKREDAKKALEQKRLEEAALEAAGLAAGVTKTSTTTKSTTGEQLDVSGMSQEQLVKTAKACILAMDSNFRNAFCADEEVQKALGLVG